MNLKEILTQFEMQLQKKPSLEYDERKTILPLECHESSPDIHKEQKEKRLLPKYV